MAPKQIIALGGGGFSMEPNNLLLDRYILTQARTERPSVCFLPTASGDSSAYIVNFYTAYTNLASRPSHVTLFNRTPDLRDTLLKQDIIFVGGGNTKSMLAVWREWDLPGILREAWEAGVVLAGISAGAICWFEQGVTDSGAAGLAVLDCLGFLPGSCCPHYDGEAERRPAYRRFVESAEIRPGWALDDGVGIHFVDSEVHRIVSSRPQAHAYRVSVVDGVAHEEDLAVNYLGN
ncbi:MAG: Type 1 glutamine amidotransferase-like domain-containing protein [Caldilineaceae bacterium]